MDFKKETKKERETTVRKVKKNWMKKRMEGKKGGRKEQKTDFTI